jgi:hypothetical protein
MILLPVEFDRQGTLLVTQLFLPAVICRANWRGPALLLGLSRTFDNPGPPASTALLVFQGIPGGLDSEEGGLHQK